MRSALRGINGVQKVELSAFSDIYTLTFGSGAKLDEKTIQDVFKGCAYNGRKVVIEQDRKAIADFIGTRPLPASPDENPTTPGKVTLGKRLFFDARLSAHGKMSCATCHRPEYGFANPDKIAPKGFDGTQIPRNVPTIINAGYSRSLFLDGRAKTLEEQALGPIQHPAEMGSKPDELVHRLADVPEYSNAFQQEFNGPMTVERIAQAIAA
ncbi:MAG: cytochrome-c peroxidase, partial [Pirellulaceae bacterium]|nr:cytochrome-c peroxidase [Pirellulaceae bacterium]